MSNPFKPISISLLPNFTIGEVLQSLVLLVQPWKYLDSAYEDELKVKIEKYFGGKTVVLFESGRAAEFFVLKGLGVSGGDEVLVQAFTCVAVPNSVLWVGAKPVFVDIDEGLNMDPDDLLKKITKKTKVIIYQGTFGENGQIEKVRQIARNHKIPLVLDLAHGLGNPVLEEAGDISFLSFGRDKVISGIWGGAVVASDLKLMAKIERIRNLESRPHRKRWVFRQLLSVSLVYSILETYSFLNLGKVLHKVFRLANLLPKVLDSGEKQGYKQEAFYLGMAGALARLASIQLDKLPKFMAHRKQLSAFYAKEIGGIGGSLRFSTTVSDPDDFRKFASGMNIFLGDWYDSVVAPKGTNLNAIGYVKGTCLRAEETSLKIVNLPTNPNLDLEGAKRVVEIVKKWKTKR